MLKKRNIFTTLIVFILFSFLTIEVKSFYNQLDLVKENSYKNSQKVYNTIIDQQTKSLKSISLLLSSDKTVKNAYSTDNPELIKKNFLAYWKQVKKDNSIYEIHFFKPPAESFVNFSNFSSIGSDVSDVRTDITWVTSSFKSSSHIMMCKSFAGLRATFPILDKNNKILGGLSIGKKIDWLPTTIKRLTNNESFLVYTKESTKSLLNKYYNRFVENKKIYENLILANNTVKISDEVFSKIDFAKKIQDIVIENNRYSLNIFPIYDFENRLMAYISVLNNLEPFYNNFYSKTIENIILILIIALLAYIFVNRKINLILKKIKIILDITNNIKNNDFKKLKKSNLKIFKSKNDALSDLEKNILQMGKIIENQLKEKDNLLTQQAKMALMGRMLDNIAHQWRQPLSIIKIGASGIKLQKECGILNDKEETDRLEDIITTSDYLSETIDDFRNFIKNGKEPKEFNLKDTIKKTKCLTLPNLKIHDIHIIENIDDVLITGFENELIQVFMNFINNAKDAFPNKQTDKLIFITIKQNDNKDIEIEFKDNAGGINLENIDNIFNERFTTKEEFGGTGIGLYLSKQIIENSFKGKVEVINDEFEYNSTSYKGAKFLITISS